LSECRLSSRVDGRLSGDEMERSLRLVRQWNLLSGDGDVLGEDVSMARGCYSSSMKRREQDRGAECRIDEAGGVFVLRRGAGGVL